MTETHKQWDIVTSVGMTALVVAAARAIETETEGGLVEDRYAAEFVRAAKPPKPMPTGLADVGDDPVWPVMAAALGVRSRFFDEVITTATGADQVVILAAGLDARAYRLDLPSSDVFEVDQPRVLEFKQKVLDSIGARPSCRSRRVVATDLRDDWTTALVESGFDRARPTIWLVEGLLPYLPAKAEEELFELVHGLSAPGSRLGIEQMPDRDVVKLMRGTAFEDSGLRLGVRLEDLMNGEPRRDPAQWLRDNGWKVESETGRETGARHGRPRPSGPVDPMTNAHHIRADLPA